MKSELFGLQNITTEEAICYAGVGSKEGWSAEQLDNNLRCIDDLLWWQNNKVFMTKRRVDQRQHKAMLSVLIDKFQP